MADARAAFRQKEEEAAAAARQREEEERRKKERQEAAGGVTKIGTKKGTAKALATAFQAKAEGHDVEIMETKGGWSPANVTSSAHGKWEGGSGGVKAKVIEKETPQGPPPKKSITDLP